MLAQSKAAASRRRADQVTGTCNANPPGEPQRPLRDSDSETAVTLAPCGRMDTACLFPCVVSDRLAEKLSPRAAASMRSPLARPEIVPEALRLDSLHEPEIAPPR